jgi:hypothetical protein
MVNPEEVMATATAETPAKRKRKGESPPEASGPLVCQPVGSLALSAIEDFPANVADMLDRLGIGTITALESRITKESEKREGVSMETLIHDTLVAITGMGSYLCQTAATAVLRHLNIGIEQVTDAEPEAEVSEAELTSGDEPVPEPAEAPAVPPSDPPTDTTTAAAPEGDGYHTDPLPVLTPSRASHLSPEALAIYDAETVRLITEQEQIVAEKLLYHKDLQKRAKDAKDIWEEETLALHAMIRSRNENRGRKPTPTLFDSLNHKTDAAIEADGWRALPLSSAHLTVEQIQACEAQEVETLGDLSEWLQGDGDRDMKEELEAAIKRWEKQQAAAAQVEEPKALAADALEELWREFPLDRWTEYGLTASDVKKLAEGTVKRDNSTFPLRTVGDLNRFTTPPEGMPTFNRGYGDIKGIGAAGVDRISEAETKFWAAWNAGLKERFAQERGLTVEVPLVPSEANDETATMGGNK